MPDLQDILKHRDAKKFTKKAYRPWDLSGGPAPSAEDDKAEQDSETTLLANAEIEPSEKNVTQLNQDSKQTPENTIQMDIKKDTNKISKRYLSDSNTDIKKVTKGYQQDILMENNKKSIGYQTDIQLDTAKKNEARVPDAHLLNLKPAFKHQEAGLSQNFEFEIIKLSGKQKIIFDLIIEICTTRNCLETGPLETASLACLANTTTGSLKIIIKRLIDKGIVIRHPGKNAKGGYINLGIRTETLDILRTIKHNKSSIYARDILYRYQKDISIDIQNPISSNSNKITTTETHKNEQMSQEWDINFDPLLHIGFSKTQIKQIIGKNDPSIVQESIYHFAYGLEHNPKTKAYNDPLNVLMGVLRKGQAWIESDYRSPIEIAQEKIFEAKKAEIERKKALEENAFKLALSEWEESLTEHERQQFSARKAGDLTPPKAKLAIYFRENVWPLKRGEYVLF